MKVYIDGGAYNGDSLDCRRLFSFKADYIIAFEPNPDMFPTLAHKLHDGEINELHNAIIWTEETILPFSVDNGNPPLGSSAMPSKKTYDTGTLYELHAIDFAEFVSGYKDDELLVKLDIEGAEFPVLRKLIDTGNIKYIDRLAVEFHPNKVTEYTTQDKDNLIAELQTLTNFEEWH